MLRWEIGLPVRVVTDFTTVVRKDVGGAGPISHRRELSFPTKYCFGYCLTEQIGEGVTTMPISVSMIALSSQLIVAVSNGVPVFDITRTCKLDLAATAGLSDNQSIQACIRDEKRAQQQLGTQWSKYPASSKAQCIPQESVGGTPSYVSLQTCLQMNQWAR